MSKYHTSGRPYTQKEMDERLDALEPRMFYRGYASAPRTLERAAERPVRPFVKEQK